MAAELSAGRAGEREGAGWRAAEEGAEGAGSGRAPRAAEAPLHLPWADRAGAEREGRVDRVRHLPVDFVSKPNFLHRNQSLLETL